MNIYFSGIEGMGIGPLAILAKKAGYGVFGSDEHESLMLNNQQAIGIDPHIGKQTDDYLQWVIDEHGVDWFVYTSALPDDHPELQLARRLDIKTSKRDELINKIVADKRLKMIVVAGTHGKTTTVSMLIWTFLQLGIPIDFLNGTTTSFAPPADFNARAHYLVYEGDEFDRNFLQFRPYLALIPAISYDHVDIFPSVEDYRMAFQQFIAQSEWTFSWQRDGLGGTVVEVDTGITLVGKQNRENATLVKNAMLFLGTQDEAIGEKLGVRKPQVDDNGMPIETMEDIMRAASSRLNDVLNEYTGSDRRFEKLADNLYTDYAHHPNEIKATIEMAREITAKTGQKLAVIYEPLQNMRQHYIRHLYKDTFLGVDKLFWLPSYQLREDPKYEILTPETLIEEMDNKQIAEPAEANKELFRKIDDLRKHNFLVLLLAGGSHADPILRKHYLEEA
ncbi:MAG: Mur ligase domain-containing protein [Candidatus Nomurabacteria bacterium]|jgi:UDP-N-acetylmuramate--alanine ligase|nr:Mur ligase domain-containing protein [Candidatus Nomurabacteria bacterium]